MRQKFIITLTSVRGSRQYTLSQVAGYLLALFLILAALSFFVSNLLLVKTREDLSGLELQKQALEDQFSEALGTQQLYLERLTELSNHFAETFYERSQLEEENLRLDADLSELESLLGFMGELPPQATAAERSALLKAASIQRLFLLHSIPNGLPIKGVRMGDRFGSRLNPVTKRRSPHHGIDFPAPTGTPIYATADGIVEQAGFDQGSGFGNLIVLQHNFGFKTYFAHLSRLSVKAGQYVHKGQKIGYSGNTGRSTGPHLHYEVRHLYSPIDPIHFIRWGLDNFESLFTAVEDIPWESLSAMYPLNQSAQQ
ncbi:M23 family metallopeptidase [Nitrincola tapanii]|uniref:M23 family metallopeptidase n=1 Tax=Nitrincola tapanii TaxID=1708751 RepID=A0A5A9W6L3_9GAMM|nr:M23 family metallopeptidase [Nitrincola tapanii]KAA0875659.1 M23 family metallopeptidase [Nitrincola tapanii]